MSESSLFQHRVLVVNQKAKLIELTNQYSVFDENGNNIGHVNQVGQSKAKKLLRLVSSVDQFLTHHFDITDANDSLVMSVTRPAKILKSTVLINDSTGAEIGRIVQENVFGKIHFALEAGGAKIGAIKAENWRAWNFAIEDASGREVARITKKYAGLAREVFTTADSYVVEIHEIPSQPLHSLIIAAALSIDTALKQDSRL
ncbi:MAG: phospholipid scramblase family protein [Ilumatobacteraceae bacterium]|jgi:uncharacterized protein YxjI|nr:phospholipid scramblase family protein [Ilumatobacteraceae bacterium]MDP5109663.1 phospholipid scramblase family protein [Ilumatobacteraceae bacterium]